MFHYFLFMRLKNLASTYLLLPGGQLALPNLTPVQTPFVPLRFILFETA